MKGVVTTRPPRELLRLFAALSDENRYRIVELLSKSEVDLSCGAISGALGLSPSLISHHLAILESAEVIERRREGLWTKNGLRREVLLGRIAALSSLLG